MKIPQIKVPLDDLGYAGYFVTVPRSVKEGFVYDLQKGMGTNGTAKVDEGTQAAEDMRHSSLKILALVSEWNLDDDEGKVLPLLSTLKKDEDKVKVVAEIPIEIIKTITEKVTASSRVAERVKDF